MDARSATLSSIPTERGYLETQDASYLIQYDAAIAQIRMALSRSYAA